MIHPFGRTLETGCLGFGDSGLLRTGRLPQASPAGGITQVEGPCASTVGDRMCGFGMMASAAVVASPADFRSPSLRTSEVGKSARSARPKPQIRPGSNRSPQTPQPSGAISRGWESTPPWGSRRRPGSSGRSPSPGHSLSPGGYSSIPGFDSPAGPF
jgi:hypothetical protein